MPDSVTVATGKTSVTFTVKTKTVEAQKAATITATFAGASKTAKLTIKA